MVHLIQATAELTLGLQGLEGKGVTFVSELVEFLFLVLSATEATRYAVLSLAAEQTPTVHAQILQI